MCALRHRTFYLLSATQVLTSFGLGPARLRGDDYLESTHKKISKTLKNGFFGIPICGIVWVCKGHKRGIRALDGENRQSRVKVQFCAGSLLRSGAYCETTTNKEERK